MYSAWKKLVTVRNSNHCIGNNSIHDKPYHNPNIPPFMAGIILEGRLDVISSFYIRVSRDSTNS
jgi:hypothetical protein